MQILDCSNIFIIVFFAGSFVSFAVTHYLEFIDFAARRKNGGLLPNELLEIPAASCFDKEKLSKIVQYENAKYFAFIPSSICELFLKFLLVILGFYPYLFNEICKFTGEPSGFVSTYFCAFLFMILASVPVSVLSIPFDLYEEFVIEKKFGFSKMTVKMWIADFVKSVAVGLIITALLYAAIVAVLIAFVSTWWIFAALILIAFTFVMLVLYPLVIAPLFNKFTPLEDGELKNRISKLMENLGFKTSGIFVMDASKRSGHSNAYFGGLGKSKRIVLYDTLIKQLEVDELVAVLGHELGHYKLRHILRRVLIIVPLEFFIMLLLYKCSQMLSLYHGFGFSITAESINSMQFMGLFLSSLIFGAVKEFFSPISNFSSRRDEFAADAFSAKVTKNPQALISGLVKLNSENLSELFPPKLYVIWNYSHPTLMERIRALQKI